MLWFSWPMPGPRFVCAQGKSRKQVQLCAPVKSWKCDSGRSDVTTNAREQGLETSPARYWQVMPALPGASENSGPPAGYGGSGWPVAR